MVANRRTAFHPELQELVSGSMPGTRPLACVVIKLEDLHQLLRESSIRMEWPDQAPAALALCSFRVNREERLIHFLFQFDAALRSEELDDLLEVEGGILSHLPDEWPTRFPPTIWPCWRPPAPRRSWCGEYRSCCLRQSPAVCACRPKRNSRRAPPELTWSSARRLAR